MPRFVHDCWASSEALVLAYQELFLQPPRTLYQQPCAVLRVCRNRMCSVKMECAQCKPQGQFQFVIMTFNFLSSVYASLILISAIPFFFSMRHKLRVPEKDALLAGRHIFLYAFGFFLCVNVEVVHRTGTIIKNYE